MYAPPPPSRDVFLVEAGGGVGAVYVASRWRRKDGGTLIYERQLFAC